MPCYERRIVTAKLSALDLGILQPALTAAGFTVRDTTYYYGHLASKPVSVLEVTSADGHVAAIYTALDGERTIQADERSQHLIDEIKRTYAFAVVQEVTRYGWDVEVDGNQMTLNQQGGSEW